MHPKTAFDSLLKRFAQWSIPPKSQSHIRPTYRTEFQRFSWGMIFLIAYSVLILIRFFGDQAGSLNNNGVWFIIIFGFFFIAIGACFAPAWSAIVNTYTASGRRLALEKQSRINNGRHPKKGQANSDSGRSSSFRGSNTPNQKQSHDHHRHDLQDTK